MQRPTEEFELKFQDADTVLEEDDFEHAKSIDDIKQTLDQKEELAGLNEKGREITAYRKALKSWRKLNRKEIGRTEVEQLPSYSTDFNGEKLHVHGYSHGQTWLPNSKKVREVFTETVRKNSSAGKNVLLEERLLDHLTDDHLKRRENVQELRDVSENLPRKISEARKNSLPEELQQELNNSWKDKISGLVPMHYEDVSKLDRVLQADRTLRIYSMSAMASISNHFSYDLARTGNLSRKDPAYSLDHVNCVRSTTLPLKLLDGVIAAEPRVDVLEVQRSIYQAERALRSDGDAHLIVGTGHLPQIEDYVDRIKEKGRKGNLPPS